MPNSIEVVNGDSEYNSFFLGPEGDLVISLCPKRDGEPCREAKHRIETDPSREAQPSETGLKVRPVKDLWKPKMTPDVEVGMKRTRREAAEKAAPELIESDQDLFS